MAAFTVDLTDAEARDLRECAEHHLLGGPTSTGGLESSIPKLKGGTIELTDVEGSELTTCGYITLQMGSPGANLASALDKVNDAMAQRIQEFLGKAPE